MITCLLMYLSMMLAKTSSIPQKTRLGRKYKLSGFLATTKQFELSNASGVYFTALWAIAEYFFRRRVNFQDLLKREKKYSETSLKKKNWITLIASWNTYSPPRSIILHLSASWTGKDTMIAVNNNVVFLFMHTAKISSEICYVSGF